MRSFTIPATFTKAAGSGEWKVGGVASGCFRDLDGEAITPEAIQKAIPDFMASRGADGKRGGPIRLHHDFWTGFLRQAINALHLSTSEQMDLVAAIALPIGRVTKMDVDSSGRTNWEGVLSQSHPIARILWNLLKEGLVSLGVSLGGKIFSTMDGRDKLGQACQLITAVRLDELSITDNPAFRLTKQEDVGNGAYIQALAKSVRGALQSIPLRKSAMRMPHPDQVRAAVEEGVRRGLKHGFLKTKVDPAQMTDHARMFSSHVQKLNYRAGLHSSNPQTGEVVYKIFPKGNVNVGNVTHVKSWGGKSMTKAPQGTDWLRSTINRSLQKSADPQNAVAPGGKEFNSGDWKNTKTGMAKNIPADKENGKPAQGGGSFQRENVKPGVGMPQPTAEVPHSKSPGFATDVWKLSVAGIARELSKCCSMDKTALSSPETLNGLEQAALALSTVTADPPPQLINLMRMLQQVATFSGRLPVMDEYQCEGTVKAMRSDLKKALDSFMEEMPDGILNAKPYRPPGSAPISKLDVVFPSQYAVG